MADIIKLPGLDERFWQQVLTPARATMISHDARPEAVEWVIGDVKRRCEGMTIGIMTSVPAGSTELLQEVYAAFITQMLLLELDLWSARHPAGQG